MTELTYLKRAQQGSANVDACCVGDDTHPSSVAAPARSRPTTRPYGSNRSGLTSSAWGARRQDLPQPRHVAKSL